MENKHIFIVFYSVTNELDYDRHSFDFDDAIDAMGKLLKLHAAQRAIYCLTKECQWCMNLKEFELDYNDEIFDGGWWCKQITLFDHEIEIIKNTML